MVVDCLDKIEVCFREIGMCRQLLASERADDFAARLLSLYILMRTDDITKIWSHTLERGSESRIAAQEVLKQYNKVREARDRLGAHYQSPAEDDSVDIFGSGQLFRRFFFKDIDTLVAELFTVRELIEGKPGVEYEFESVHDFDLALQTLDALYSDECAYLTNSALELFGINRGGLMSCTNAQRKGQYLRGIEQMIVYIHRLYDRPYTTKEVKDMFKRYLVTLIFNYHDNLFTRTDISENSPQYQIGFDRLYPSLPCEKRDNMSLLEGVFDRFESETGVKAYFRSKRPVRDKSCAHFDESSTMAQIECILDTLDAEEIYGRYRQMLGFFNWLSQHTFVMEALSLPSRSPLYDIEFETSQDAVNFYGKKPKSTTQKELTADELIRLLIKQDKERERAKAQIVSRLNNYNEEVFEEMMAAIAQRLEDIKGGEADICDLINCVYSAKRGYPERLQTALLRILTLHPDYKTYSEVVLICLMWALSEIALKSKDYDIFEILGGWVNVTSYPQRCFGILGYLHALITERDVNRVIKGTARKVDDRFAALCSSLGNPAESLGIWLAMCNHWTQGEDYPNYRMHESEYDAFLRAGLQESLARYTKYIRLGEGAERDEWLQLASTGHYLTLLYRLAQKEQVRKQKYNAFLTVWGCSCFVNRAGDAVEAEAMAELQDMF